MTSLSWVLYSTAQLPPCETLRRRRHVSRRRWFGLIVCTRLILQTLSYFLEMSAEMINGSRRACKRCFTYILCITIIIIIIIIVVVVQHIVAVEGRYWHSATDRREAECAAVAVVTPIWWRKIDWLLSAKRFWNNYYRTNGNSTALRLRSVEHALILILYIHRSNWYEYI